MEENKNKPIVGRYQQLVMSYDPSLVKLPSEEDLKKALLLLDLLVGDFEKSLGFLNQLEHFVSSPLDFKTFERKMTDLIEGTREITERALDNYHYLSGNLKDIYTIFTQTVESENAIGETHESINVRFKFWLHSYRTENAGEGKGSKEIQTFSEFIQLLSNEQSGYTYFISPLGETHFLICQYAPLESSPEKIELHFSTYVEPPDTSFQSLKRAWNKMFSAANKRVYHVFRDSPPNSTIGTFKERLSVSIPPYTPHRYNYPEQLTKVIYDFINVYGVDGRRHIHLLRHNDKFAVFTTHCPIRFDGRFVVLSDVDTTNALLGENHRVIFE